MLVNGASKFALGLLRRVRLLDSTSITALECVVASAQRYGTQVILCGVREDVATMLESPGLDERIGRENIMDVRGEPFAGERFS